MQRPSEHSRLAGPAGRLDEVATGKAGRPSDRGTPPYGDDVPYQLLNMS